MQSFQQFTEARGPSSKVQAMIDLVDAIKNTLKNYGPSVRHDVWRALISEKGQRQINRVLRSPNTPISQSDFTKLVL